MSARAHSERSERPPETEPRAEAAGGSPVAAALLALQRTAGNRAVRSLIAREPGADAPTPVERDIREFEDTLGHPLPDADRNAMERALSAPRTAESGHSAFELGATALAHPIKTAEHVGPKALMPDKLSEEHYLLDRFPNLFP